MKPQDFCAHYISSSWEKCYTAETNNQKSSQKILNLTLLTKKYLIRLKLEINL